jgi:hypothetical protein
MQNHGSRTNSRGTSYLNPTATLFFTLTAFNLLPGLWISWTDWKEDLYFEYSYFEYFAGVDTYIRSCAYFLTTFAVTAALLGSNVFKVRSKTSDRLFNVTAQQVNLFSFTAYRAITIIGIVFTTVYFVQGGYQKLLLFGSNIDEWAFRLIGYDDRSRFLIAGLEASRRVLLPLGVSYLFVLFRMGNPAGILRLLVVGAVFQLLGAAMTLDRAPILLFFVMFLFVNSCLGMTFGKLLRTLVLAILVIMPIAGLTTFLQYNIRTFSFSDIVETGQNFLLHRTLIVPSIASIELSFVQFPEGSDKLMLRFSRLTALVGGDYVGTEDINSLFVTPVGAIADVWRNFGMPGIVISGAALAGYFNQLDRMMRNLNPVACIVHSFNALSLAFYFVFGVLFSQGILFQMLLGYAFLYYERVRLRQGKTFSRGEFVAAPQG